MNTYCTPTLYNERLGNGDKIPIILYELNPSRDPNNRINFYRNNFNSKNKLNKTLPYFTNQKKNKNTRATKSTKLTKNTLYKTFYSNVLRINFERPREIINENGVIISRHFRSLNVNSREYPKTRIKIFSFRKNSYRKGINDKSNKRNNYNGNFFSTEIKFHKNNNKNAKNINLKNENTSVHYNYNNFFTKTFNNSKTNNLTTHKSKNKLSSYENTKSNHFISPKYTYNGENLYSKLPLLLYNMK